MFLFPLSNLAFLHLWHLVVIRDLLIVLTIELDFLLEIPVAGVFMSCRAPSACSMTR
jgi:hypothetical protein